MRISDLEFRRVLFRSRDAGIRVGDDESVVAVVEQTPAVGIEPEILELPAAGRDGARLGVIAARGPQVERAVPLVLGPGAERADRKRDVAGKRDSDRVYTGGPRSFKKKNSQNLSGHT